MKKVLSIAAVVSALIVGSLLVSSYQQQPEFKFKFTQTEVQTILTWAEKQPNAESAPIINKILKQASDTAFQKK